MKAIFFIYLKHSNTIHTQPATSERNDSVNLSVEEGNIWRGMTVDVCFCLQYLMVSFRSGQFLKMGFSTKTNRYYIRASSITTKY